MKTTEYKNNLKQFEYLKFLNGNVSKSPVDLRTPGSVTVNTMNLNCKQLRQSDNLNTLNQFRRERRERNRQRKAQEEAEKIEREREKERKRQESIKRGDRMRFLKEEARRAANLADKKRQREKEQKIKIAMQNAFDLPATVKIGDKEHILKCENGIKMLSSPLNPLLKIKT